MVWLTRPRRATRRVRARKKNIKQGCETWYLQVLANRGLLHV